MNKRNSFQKTIDRGSLYFSQNESDVQHLFRKSNGGKLKNAKKFRFSLLSCKRTGKSEIKILLRVFTFLSHADCHLMFFPDAPLFSQ